MALFTLALVVAFSGTGLWYRRSRSRPRWCWSAVRSGVASVLAVGAVTVFLFSLLPRQQLPGTHRQPRDRGRGARE